MIECFCRSGLLPAILGLSQDGTRAACSYIFEDRGGEMFKKIGLGLLALLILAIAAGIIYYLVLTAPVEVSNQVPVAPTLAVARTVPSLPTVTPQNTPITGATTNSTTLPTPPPTNPASPSPTAPIQPTSQPTQASAPTLGLGTAQVYRIDATQSKAYYEIDEVFLDENNRLFTAVGTTTAIAGDVLLDKANPNASKVGEIVIDISQMQSDNSRRDNAIRRQWLESARYPLVTFKNSSVEGLPASFSEGVEFSFRIKGDMTIRTVTKPVTWEVKAKLEGNVLRGLATMKLKLSDFQIPNPSLVTIRVSDNLTLKLDFVAKAVIAN
jgi:polyisoprenoid-binding protein YceI